MWLALDIGNSAVKGGVFDGAGLRRTFRVAFRAPVLSETGEATLQAALDDLAVRRIGIVSVVPARTEELTHYLRAWTGVEAQVFTAEARLPFQTVYETPQTLGIDRLAAAVAAWTRHRLPSKGVVAIDAGTALTFEVIRPSGVYEGGIIAPGPGLLQRALHTGTAQLPTVPLDVPEALVGRSTVTSMQVGIMHGFVETVRGLLRRVIDDQSAPPVVVATGGWAELLAEHIEAINVVEPNLVLYGVHALMRLNP